MSSRRSSRTRSRLRLWSHASVRSTTQRYRPSRSLDSMPRRAMRGMMCHRRSPRRMSLKS